MASPPRPAVFDAGDPAGLPDEHTALLAWVATAAAELATAAETSDTRCLHRLAALAAEHLPGCAGATASLWRDGQQLAGAASHPDLAALLEAAACEPTPLARAARTREAVDCPDTLAELREKLRDGSRWPGFATACVRAGVRCLAVRAMPVGEVTLSLALYGTRPGALDAASIRAGSVLAAVGGASLASAPAHDQARRTARELTDSVASRAIVDQATGVLMHASGCDAEAAFSELRRRSQRSNTRVTEIARTVVANQARRGRGAAAPGG